jgi:hypothetical protein
LEGNASGAVWVRGWRYFGRYYSELAPPGLVYLCDIEDILSLS